MRLIDKDALVAEINKLKNISLEYGYTTEQSVIVNVGKDLTLRRLLDYIDTLEVKEVDLYEDADNYWGTLTSDIRGNIYLNDFYKIAEHFFELGMSVSNKAQKEE
jgi:hypothetical protein